ncbi:hypothetical protein K435DRAFT_850906 [Dendrothele bispora CBS 962.96]|uniref:Uncharacterized protein n=1 Tax=Dendrothele bispora (strain CBS 962.96) TaxID=1314807 RepID=A0A4S8MNP2_DENBC|nr:hypothetical protein K435DRAFT_850906 [Dendrothele bispora CBS 962.96]
MIISLETTLTDCPAGASSRVWCMGHVINLVIEAIIGPFKLAQKCKIGQTIIEVDEDEEEEDDYADDELLYEEEDRDKDEGSEDEDADEDEGGESGSHILHDELDSADREVDENAVREDFDILMMINQELEDDEEFLVTASAEEWLDARNTVRNLAKRIHWSAPLRTELKAHCKKVDIQYKTIKRIVKTRWNTYAVMLESVLHLRPALQRLCDHHSDLATINQERMGSH